MVIITNEIVLVTYGICSLVVLNFVTEFLVKFFRGYPGEEARFMKGPQEETIFVRFDKEYGLSVNQVTKADEIINDIKESTTNCNSLVGDDFSTCVADSVAENVQKLTESKTRITKYRDMMSQRLRNYTCADESLNSTAPLRTQDLFILNKKYVVDTLLDTTHAKIWAVHDFVTDEECDIFMKYGATRLQRATVAAEDGTSTVSHNRKAQQAGYEMEDKQSDPLWYIL